MPAKPPAGRSRPTFTDQEALQFHSVGRPGKLEVIATKPMATQRDLSLAYSPGVAVPVLAIAEDPSRAYDYTVKGNFVAVITNGTAILGLGNRGALAAKPVMEGKAVLFKRFADIDFIDLEVSTEDPDQFINCVRYLGAGWGGINLEDIKAPECFIIEQKLRELLDIPVFHDDQHGTAIIAAAGLLNALDLTGREIATTKLVCNGAGAAGIACLELLKAIGFKPENLILCDTKGVIYQGRKDGMNQWKSAYAIKTSKRTLAQAFEGADVAFGLSVKGAFTADMVKSMAAKPIIFALANPDPEITAEEVAEVRDDAIMATGRSDYPNQVNNILGFPFIFRGALDVRATTINMEMKIAAAKALADLAREDVPDEVAALYGARPKFGSDYIIPVPFDPRLISTVPPAVAKAAMDTGVARKPIVDVDAYRHQLNARRDPIAGTLVDAAKFAQIVEDRIQQIDRHDHIEMLVLAFARALELQRADANQIARARDQRGAAPVWVRGIGEDRLVQHILPITGEFLLGGNAAGERSCATAGTADDHAFANFRGFRGACLKRRQIDLAERLHQAKTGFLIRAKRVALHHPAVAEMQPHGVGLGDQIANGENKAIIDQHAIAGTFSAERISREGILRND